MEYQLYLDLIQLNRALFLNSTQCMGHITMGGCHYNLRGSECGVNLWLKLSPNNVLQITLKLLTTINFSTKGLANSSNP